MSVAAPHSTNHTRRRRHADAFGNALEDWETGLWMGESGWGHNTKEQSAATGLVYM